MNTFHWNSAGNFGSPLKKKLYTNFKGNEIFLHGTFFISKLTGKK
jgi:hypothetical protein